jgi:hypothetical protein
VPILAQHRQRLSIKRHSTVKGIFFQGSLHAAGQVKHSLQDTHYSSAGLGRSTIEAPGRRPAELGCHGTQGLLQETRSQLRSVRLAYGQRLLRLLINQLHQDHTCSLSSRPCTLLSSSIC